MTSRTRAPEPRRTARGRSALLAALTLAVLAGCARKGPPSGGPPDLEPPSLVSSSPDSGAAGVARDVRIALTFSEGMEPRTTGDAVELAPRADFKQRRWSGRTLTLVLAEPLKADQTYILFVGRTAHDRHGNEMRAGAVVPFTTAATFPTGRISGTIEAVGFDAAGTSLWCYDATTGKTPDSTARDFDAIGIADDKGRFEIPGLHAPGQYRLWAFADLNANRSFEPEKDVLAPADTTFELTADHPVASGFTLHMVNPRAPAKLAGSVLDTLNDSVGVVRVTAISESDTTRRFAVDVQRSGGFELTLPAGTWRVMAYRDVDRNKSWKADAEPASDPMTYTLTPAAEVKDVVLVLRRPPE